MSVPAGTVADMGKRARNRRRRQTQAAPAPAARQALRQPVLSNPGNTQADGLEQLGKLVEARRTVNEAIAAQVDDLAAAGVSWPVIADVLGVSRQAARQAHARRHATTSQRPAAGRLAS